MLAGHSKISLLQEAGAYFGCMKCLTKGTYEPGIQRMTYPGARRWLPAADPDRKEQKFGSPEERSQPRLRTHQDTLQFASVVDRARSAGIKPGSAHDPTANCGVLGSTPLARLPYYDLIRGIALDVMHLTLNCVKHMFELLKGKRKPAKPAPPKALGKSAAAEGKESKDDDGGGDDDGSKRARASDEYGIKLEAWARAAKQHEPWTLTQQQQNEVDARLSSLLAPSGLVSRSRLPFRRQGLLG